MRDKLLRLLGYKVKSVKNTKVVGREIVYFKTVSSTNVYARKLVEDGVDEGTVVVADVQVSGRGRKKRTWLSPEGGLWFSIILSPNILPQHGMMLTMAASVSVVQGIQDVTGLSSEIKWPNDILLNGRKVCGVLTELDAEMDRINYSIVGIGINVNNKLDESLYGKATTVSEEFGSQVSRVKLLQSILKNFDENYGKLIDGDYDFIRRRWVSFSNIINRKIQVKDDNKTIQGVVTDVDEDGCLILKTSEGVSRIFSGDVEYL